ncbi:AAA family ATPase [Clostridium minihomine]|uniref:AAA family ATPase n=1 Tax=Clostridium minihomine TaxID=2045012 RepID=UPI000C786C34|nr:AAA family ATPase [Clostridium minihomine]
MSKISFKLLQTPRVLLDDQPVLLPFKKAEALLYCLALKKTISREQAANLLWDTDDSQVAKKNLRHTLYTIKKAFDLELIVSPKKHLLTLNPELEYEIDYDEFMKNHDFSLSDGELMQGFSLKNADSFENWLDMERTELKEYYLRQLYDCMIESSKGDVTETESLFAKYIKKDPLDERVYQLMMECYQRNGLYYKGIKVYQNISKLLNTELRIAPCAELSQLHRELLSAWTESSSDEPEPTPSNIIGRKEEMQYLMKNYRSFLLGTPTALLLVGDNGVGKTHLVNHFFDSIGEDSCIVLKTICFQAERDFILQPWNTIMLQLDQYIRSHDVTLPAHCTTYINSLFPLFGNHTLSAQVPEDVMISYNYRTTRNSVLKLFSLLGEETPIILFFDNIQFMDHLSLELLSLIIRERNPNIMCICTCLDVQPPYLQKQINSLLREKFLSQLLISPFTQQDVADIIADRLGPDALNDQIIRHIYQDSEGNGFFLDLLLSYLTCDSASSQKTLSNPQDILLARLEELSTDARQLLDTISVCPESITLDIVEYFFNRNTLEIIELMDDLKQHSLIREKVADGQIRFQFRHAKMQDFVHSQLSPSKRRLLHARVANYYEQATDLLHNNTWYQRVIYHYAQAGNDAKVLQYKVLSLADYSRYNYELYPVLQPQKDSALEAPKQLLKYFDELKAELIRLYNYQPNVIDFAELETRLYLVVGKYCISQGRYKEGLDAIRLSLTHIDYLEQHPQVYISCLRQLTFYGIQTWNPELMRENIEKCMAIAKENRLSTDYATECRLYGLYLSMCGRYEESREQLHQAIGLFESAALDGQNYVLNLAACYNYLGEVERKQQNFEESLTFYCRALEVCSDRKYPKNPTFYSNQARALLALGRIKQASEQFFTANKLYDASNILVGRAITKSYCSLIYAAGNHLCDAKRLLTEAEKTAYTIRSPMSLGILERNKAILLQSFPEEFAEIITVDFDTCRAQSEKHFAGLPGAYESQMPFELPNLSR